MSIEVLINFDHKNGEMLFGVFPPIIKGKETRNHFE